MATIKGGGSGFVHECYYRCDSREHGSVLTGAVTKASLSDEKVAAYVKWCCIKYAQALDANGRSLIHVAASMGRLKLLMFLLNHRNVNINFKDQESNYTALHRSLFYGQIHCAVRLIQAGANLHQIDLDELTPLDHLMKDRPSILTYDEKQPCEVYVWGTNMFYNLGLGHNNSRSNPEPLSFFRKENILVKKAFMSKFHSLFIGNDGKVWVCGLGSGGRLGLGEEETTLVPRVLKIANNPSYCCEAVSVGINHTLLLLENGSVWSFGLNTHHQLGHYPPPEEVLSPKPIKSLTGINIVGISASKFHSVFWTKNQLYTCGLHGGHLGHIKTNENTIATPKLVTSFQLKASTIKHVATSDGATVVVSSKGDIFLFRDYQCKRLKTSKLVTLETKKICVLGGHLDHKVFSSSLRERGGDDLKILILTEGNSIYLWQETYQRITLCLPSLHRYINFTDMILNKTTVMLTTSDGEAFLGEIKIKKKSQISSETEKPLSPMGGFHKYSDREDCDYLKLKRIPHVHRAVSIASDLKGKNFAVVQVYPKTGLLRIPSVEATAMKQDMKMLLETASESDDLHDVSFRVGETKFPSHRYVVSSSSKVLEEMIAGAEVVDDVRLVQIENVQPQIFERVLSYLYTGDCDFFRLGICPVSFDPPSDPQEIPEEVKDSKEISAFEYYKQQRSSKRKSGSKNKLGTKDPLELLREAARIFDLNGLTKALESLSYENGHICKTKKKNLDFSSPAPAAAPKFDRNNLPDLWDVSLKAQDGTVIKAHKCILVARLEYFNCMITRGWLESSSKTPLSLSIPSPVLKILIRYLYTDEVPELADSHETDLPTQILVIADQFLCTRLKEIAEVSLSNAISLKNAAEMLQLAVTYHADQLKQCSMEFICLNLPSLLETRSLEILDDSLLAELKDFYRSWLPCMTRRNIATNSPDPDDDLVETIFRSEPVSLEKVEENEEEGKEKEDVAESWEAKPILPKPKEKRKRNGESERMRNASTGSIASDEEPLRGRVSESSECENGWIKVTGHNSKSESKTSPKGKPIRCETITHKTSPVPSEAKASPEAKALPDVPVQRSAPVQVVRPPSAFKRDTLSDSERDFGFFSTSSDKEFPVLGASPAQERIAVVSPKSPIEISKKFVKLSQRQRKKLAVKSVEEISEATAKSPDSAKSVWGIFKYESNSLDAIMKEEVEASKSGSVHPSSPPWQASPSPTSSPSLSAIMAAERHHRDLVLRMKSKSLEHAQMEDKAIDDLMLLYDISNVTDERITIRRADSALFFSPPVWVSGHR